NFRHDGHRLGAAALKQFFHARKTLGDIFGRRDTAGMEGTHGQLGARLTDRLGRDDADAFADLDALAVGHVGTIAPGADADMGAAGHDAADLKLGNAGFFDLFGVKHVHHPVFGNKQVAGVRVKHIMQRITADQAFGKAFDRSIALADFTDHDAFGGVAVFFADDDFLADIDETAGQVTRVGGAQRGIGQTLAGASGRNEIFKDVQAFAVVGANRHFQRFAGGIGQQAAHAGQLLDLVHRTTGTGVRHHIDGVALVVGAQVGGQRVRDFLGGLLPDFNRLLVALFIRNQAAVEVLHDLF